MAPAAPFDYPGALEYIASTGRFGIKMGLERTRALLDEVGAPDRGLKGVLVGGTNGKGSTCAFLAAILRTSGLRVAEMPKPHLVSYTERVVLDGRPITEADFAHAVSEMVSAVERVTPGFGSPTEFEILTALALRYARDQGAGVLVCEVGMGGRLDATNITDLGVKVITSIALDHQQYLGDTIAAIAGEKAGIIHPGDLVVTGELPPEALEVVLQKCAAVGAELILSGRDFAAVDVRPSWTGTTLGFEASTPGWLRSVPHLETSLLGDYQARNAAVAVAAAQAVARRHAFSVVERDIREGCAAARWPGRLERFAGSPDVVVDGGHNPAAVATVVAAIEALGTGRPPVVLFGAMADKDVDGMLRRLPRTWPAVFTQVVDARAISAGKLLGAAVALGRVGDSAAPDTTVALGMARQMAGEAGMVVVLGSLYLAGAVRHVLTAAGG